MNENRWMSTAWRTDALVVAIIGLIGLAARLAVVGGVPVSAPCQTCRNIGNAPCISPITGSSTKQLADARVIQGRLLSSSRLRRRDRSCRHRASSRYFGAQTARAVWLWGLSILLSFPLLMASAMPGWCVRDDISAPLVKVCTVLIAGTVAVHLISFGDPRFHLPLVPVFAVMAARLGRRRSGFHPRRLIVAAVLLLVLVLPWSLQLATYWTALRKVTAPGGWNSQLSFDDLL